MYGLWEPDAELTTWLAKASREEIYQRAIHYFLEKNIAPALFLCDRLASIDRVFIKALLLKARICEYMNNSKEAIRSYENALNIKSEQLGEDDPHVLIARNALTALMPLKDPNFDLFIALFNKACAQIKETQSEHGCNYEEAQKIWSQNCPVGMLYAHLLFMLQAEVINGGFQQYFYNSSGQFYSETINALNSVGAEKYVDLLSQAHKAHESGNEEELQTLSLRFEDCDVNDLDWYFANYAKKSPESFQ